MFTTQRTQELIQRLEDCTARGELWMSSPATGPRLDFFSAMEPQARVLLDQGFGPGGDPVWMGTMIDQGWPEWLVMLMLSLTYASVGDTSGARYALPPRVRAEFTGSDEDAAAFVFVRACVDMLDSPLSSATLRRRYAVDRFCEGAFNALKCVEDAVGTGNATPEGLAFFEDLSQALSGSDGMMQEDTRAWRAKLRDLDVGATPAELRDYASSVLSIDDYTPLYALTWPTKSEERPWAPSDQELIKACRQSLLDVLHASR